MQCMEDLAERAVCTQMHAETRKDTLGCQADRTGRERKRTHWHNTQARQIYAVVICIIVDRWLVSLNNQALDHAAELTTFVKTTPVNGQLYSKKKDVIYVHSARKS